MGIPGVYGKWVSKEVRQAIADGLPLVTAGFSFDLNGAIHAALNETVGENVEDPRFLQALANMPPEQFELNLYNNLDSIILKMVQATNPRDYLMLAVDGVAPGAKLQQQKGRRERAARERSPISIFDKNAITPGTDFMMRLDNHLVRFIAKYRNILPPTVIYSSHLVPGEGEHKIMDFYRSGRAMNGQTAKDGGAHVLYGLDADLIMLSLLAPIDRIVLSRETVKETLEINAFREYLMTNGKRPSSVDDFVVMMYLLGNDFLPHMPALEEMAESISAILEIYNTGDYVLTHTNANGRHEINWNDMKRFVQVLAARENEFLVALTTKQVTYPSRFLQGALKGGQFYPNLFRSAWYDNALGPKGQEAFTNTLTQIISKYQPTEQDLQINPFANEPIAKISEVTTDRIIDMAIDYMRTMSWTYLYYREGTAAINQDWAYPYYHTPMLTDLAIVMQLIGTPRTILRMGAEITFPIEITGYEAHDGMIQFTALHQLVAVLPLKSRDLLPLELQSLFSYNSIIRDLQPDSFIVEVDGKTKPAKGPIPGVPIVPMIDRQRIVEAVAQIMFTPDRVQLWLPANEETFALTPDEIEIYMRAQFDRQRQAEFLEKQARGRGRGRGEGFNQPTTQQTPFVPRSPRGRGRGGDRGGRGRGGRGRGGGIRGEREGGQVEVRRPPTVPIVNARAPTVPTVGRGGPPTVIQRGPTLVPIGAQTPTILPVGRRIVPQVPVVPVAQPVQQAARSPAQWKQLTPLM